MKRPQEPTQPPEVCTKRRIFSMNAREIRDRAVEKGRRNSGITKTDQKKHMIWGNTHKLWFKNLFQYSMAGKAPGVVPVSACVTMDIQSPGRPRDQLPGIGSRGQGGCGLPWSFPGEAVPLLPGSSRQGPGGKAEHASREIHLFQIKAQKSCIRGRSLVSILGPVRTACQEDP